MLKSLKRSHPFLVARRVPSRLVATAQKDCNVVTNVDASKDHTNVFPRKPIILLDVDGVINFLSASEDKVKKDWPDAEVVARVDAGKNSYKIKFSPKVIQKINEWNKIADVRWLTAWNENARKHLAPALKLDDFPVGRTDEQSKVGAAIKTAKEVGPDGLVIWIDDDLKKWKENNEAGVKDVGESGNKKSLDELAMIFDRPNTVLLSPHCGLTDEHLKFVDDVLQNPELTKGKCVTNLEPGERNNCAVM